MTVNKDFELEPACPKRSACVDCRLQVPQGPASSLEVPPSCLLGLSPASLPSVDFGLRCLGCKGGSITNMFC